MKNLEFGSKFWGLSAAILAFAAIACERQAIANAKVLGKCVSGSCVGSDCSATCTKAGDLCVKDGKADIMVLGSNIDTCDTDASQTCPVTGFLGLSTCTTSYQCVCVAGGNNTFACGKGDAAGEYNVRKCKKP